MNNKLTHVESQRIYSILEETVQKLYVISVVNKDFISSFGEDGSEFLGEELFHAFKTQKKNEDWYTENISNKKLDKMDKVPRVELDQNFINIIGIPKWSNGLQIIYFIINKTSHGKIYW
jgi:hypothetical protein